METSEKREENRDLIGHRDAEKGSHGESDQSPTAGPPCNARNMGKTVAANIAFFGGGIGNAIIGATLLHLRHQTETSVENVASLFTWRALGCLCGNLFVAAIFDHTRPEAVLAIASFMVGFMTLCVPWCDEFLYLALVMAMQGFSHGMLGGGCNGYVVKIWQLRSPPFLQFLQFITSFGSAITPFMVDFFVTTSLTDPVVTISDHVNASTSYGANFTTSATINATLHDVIVEQYLDVFWDVLYPYTIGGVVMMIGGLAFILVLIGEIRASVKMPKKTKKRENSLEELGSMTNIRTATEEENVTVRRNKSHILFTIMVIAFCVVYGGMECTYGGFILTFAVEYLGVSFETATIVSTAYWGALAGGRALAVILVKFFKPHTMIIFSLILSTTAILTLTLACDLHIAVCMICSAMIGLSFAPLFGNVIAFSQQVIPVTGRETSLFVVGLYIGFVGTPAIVGYLFTKFSPMLLLYVMSVAVVTACGLFVGVMLVARSCVQTEKANAVALEKSSIRNLNLEKIKSIEMLTSRTSLT